MIVLFELNHASLSTPLRRAGNTEDITSNGNVYTAAGLKAALPDDVPDELPEVTVILEDISQEFIAAIRSIDSVVSDRPTVTTSIILASAPDDILMSFDWEVKESIFNGPIAQFRLAFQDLLREPFPGQRFLPSNFPALFQ